MKKYAKIFREYFETSFHSYSIKSRIYVCIANVRWIANVIVKDTGCQKYIL